MKQAEPGSGLGDFAQAVDSYLVAPRHPWSTLCYGVYSLGSGNKERQKGTSGNWVIYLGIGK